MLPLTIFSVGMEKLEDQVMALCGQKILHLHESMD
jgi:hypothetical protein